MAFQGNQEYTGFDSDNPLMEDFWDSAWGDYEKMDKSWQAGMDKAEEGHDWMMSFGDREKVLYDESMERMNKNQKETLEKAEARGQEGVEIGEDYRQQTEAWAEDVTDKFEEGSDRARKYMEESISKLEEVKGEYKDYTTEALSGQVAGTTARFNARKEQRMDSARRSGAGASVIDQIGYEMDRDMGSQLQTQIAQSAGKYQEGMVQLGVMEANQLASAAGQEVQLTSLGATVEDRKMQGRMRGLDMKTQAKMNKVESLKNLEMNFASNKEQYEQAHLQRQLRAEELKMQGAYQYADYIMNHPPTAMADLFATMINYAAMSGYKKLAKMKGPGSNKSISSADKKIMADNPGINWDETSMEDFKNMQRNRRYGVTASAGSFGVSYG